MSRIMKARNSNQRGQALVELLIAMTIAGIVATAGVEGFVASRESYLRTSQYSEASAILNEQMEALRSIRERSWSNIAVNGTYHATVSGSQWVLTSGAETGCDPCRQIVIANTCRDGSDTVVDCPSGTVDPSTKKITVGISWTEPQSGTVEQAIYLSRHLSNTTWVETTRADFNQGTTTNTTTTLDGGGTVELDTGTPQSATYDWPFTTAGNYTYDADKIEVTGGVAQLKGTTGEGIDAYTQGIWHLNESSGDLVDASGNGNDLSLTRGIPTYSQTGKFDTAINFDGNDSKYINDGQQTGLGITGSITIDAWVYKTTAATSNEVIVGKWKETGNHRSYALLIGSTNKVEFWVSSNGRENGVAKVVAVNGFPLNQWVHLAGVYNGSNLYIFQNGTLENTAPYSNGIASKQAFFGIASAEGMGGSEAYFAGKVDEVRVSNTARWTNSFTPLSDPYGGQYPNDSPSINSTTSLAVSDLTSWDSFTETATKNGGETYYQLSDDDGATWYYWVAPPTGDWVVAGSGNYNTESEVNSNIDEFPTTGGKISFKAFLESDGSQLIILDNVQIGYTTTTAYQTSGTFESNTFNAGANVGFNYLTWGSTKPSGTTLKFQIATNSNGSTWNYVGSDGTSGIYFESAGAVPLEVVSAQYIRYKVYFTSDGVETPVLEDVTVNYSP